MERSSYLISYRVNPFDEQTIPLLIANYENGILNNIIELPIDHSFLMNQEIINLKYLTELKTYIKELLSTKQEVKLYYIKTSEYVSIYTNEIGYVKYHSFTSTGYLRFEEIKKAS